MVDFDSTSPILKRLLTFSDCLLASFNSLQAGSPYGLFRDLLSNGARSKDSGGRGGRPTPLPPLSFDRAPFESKSRNNPYGEPACRLLHLKTVTLFLITILFAAKTPRFLSGRKTS